MGIEEIIVNTNENSLKKLTKFIEKLNVPAILHDVLAHICFGTRKNSCVKKLNCYWTPSSIWSINDKISMIVFGLVCVKSS